MDRRDFIRDLLLAGAAVGLAGCRSKTNTEALSPAPGASAPPGKPTAASGTAPGNTEVAGKVGKNRYSLEPVNGAHVAIAKGKGAAENLAAALAVFGGMGAFVKAGDRVVIKPNLAWSRGPESGACTSPEMLAAVIKACRDAGAKEVMVGEHTCDSAGVCFAETGAKDVCTTAGVELVDWSNAQLYRKEALAHGETLKHDEIATDLLDCDVYINLPTLKHHSASKVSIALKNQMGCVNDRGQYHSVKGNAGQNNLHRNVVDLATALRPTLNIMDASRALVTNGPKGPGDVKELDAVCISPNIVAVDAYGAMLLGHAAMTIPHIKMAAAAGLGEADLNKLTVKKA